MRFTRPTSKKTRPPEPRYRPETYLEGLASKLTASQPWTNASIGSRIVVTDRTEAFHLHKADNVHLPLIEDFNEAIREDQEPRVPGDEAVKACWMLEAAYRSARSGEVVKFEKIGLRTYESRHFGRRERDTNEGTDGLASQAHD